MYTARKLKVKKVVKFQIDARWQVLCEGHPVSLASFW
jgi:hypothetical protein